MEVFKLNSPNFEERSHNQTINTLIIHHTNMQDAKSAIERLCSEVYKVSCHYLIDYKGAIYQLVPDNLKAWHAGKSSWRGSEGVNDFSIGIELDNQGASPFPTSQMESLLTLCKELVSSHPIEPRNIIAHYDIAPHRKDDPNHYFNWELLADNGIGIFPKIGTPPQDQAIINLSAEQITEIQKKLKIFGYNLMLTGEFDLQTNQVIIAFKRHFCSSSFISSKQELWTLEADKKLNTLMSMINE